MLFASNALRHELRIRLPDLAQFTVSGPFALKVTVRMSHLHADDSLLNFSLMFH